MKSLSLNMIVKNEEEVIARCLESVAHLVDEIIIVDTGSTDNTIEIAKSFGATIHDFKWTNSFSDARNYSLSKSKCDWQFVLDSDEYILNDASLVLKDFINNYDEAIGRIRRIDKFSYGNEIRHSKAFISRLFPRGIKFTGRIHEQLDSDLPRYKLDIEVYHDGYYLKEKSTRNIELLLHAIRDNDSDPHTLYQLAKEYKICKKNNEATPYFMKCYELVSILAPYRPNLIVDSLYNYLDLKEFDEALALIDKEYNNLVDFTDFHYVTALIYMEAAFSDLQKYGHLFTKISEEYIKCLQIGEINNYDSVIGTGSFLAMYNLGVFYETSGDIGKAIEFYKNAQKLGYEPAAIRLSNLQ